MRTGEAAAAYVGRGGGLVFRQLNDPAVPHQLANGRAVMLLALVRCGRAVVEME
jgi:hypothetical protein